MSQKRVLAQEIRLGSPDRSPRKRVGSGDETSYITPHYILHYRYDIVGNHFVDKSVFILYCLGFYIRVTDIISKSDPLSVFTQFSWL